MIQDLDKLVLFVATYQKTLPDKIKEMTAVDFFKLSDFIAEKKQEDYQFRAALAGVKIK